MPKGTSDEQPAAVYYCERCFHIHGGIVEMQPKLGRLVCPECEGEWKLNRGQARHIVSLKLLQYRTLAEELGILKQEDSAYQKTMEMIQAVTAKVEQHLDGDTEALEQLAAMLTSLTGKKGDRS